MMGRERRRTIVRSNGRGRPRGTGPVLLDARSRAARVADSPPVAGRLLQAAFRIHNGPAQYLASALAQFRVLERQIPATLPQARASLRVSIARTRAALAAAREAISCLRASRPAASSSSLVDRLRAAITDLQPLTASRFSLEADQVGPLPSVVEAGLAATGAEAMANAARHASARHIAVHVSRAGDRVVLEVRDDGTGLRQGLPASQEGMGLALMRDQLRLLGGRLSVRRVRSGGTLVRATVPVPRMERSTARGKQPSAAGDT